MLTKYCKKKYFIGKYKEPKKWLFLIKFVSKVMVVLLEKKRISCLKPIIIAQQEGSAT